MDDEAEVLLVAKYPELNTYYDEILFTLGDGRLYRWLVDTDKIPSPQDALGAIARFRIEWRDNNYVPYKNRILEVLPSLMHEDAVEESVFRSRHKHRRNTVHEILCNQPEDALVGMADILIMSGKLPHSVVRRLRKVRSKSMLAAILSTRLASLGRG